MLSISDGGSLARVPDPAVRDLINQRIQQLRTNYSGPLEEIVRFYMVEAGDTERDVGAALGFSPLRNLVDGSRFGEPDFTPSWEWSEDHGFAFELTYILDDSGFAHVLLVPKSEGINADLIAVCQTHASEHA